MSYANFSIKKLQYIEVSFDSTELQFLYSFVRNFFTQKLVHTKTLLCYHVKKAFAILPMDFPCYECNENSNIEFFENYKFFDMLKIATFCFCLFNPLNLLIVIIKITSNFRIFGFLNSLIFKFSKFCLLFNWRIIIFSPKTFELSPCHFENLIIYI